jgi:hypothetical protein
MSFTKPHRPNPQKPAMLKKQTQLGKGKKLLPEHTVLLCNFCAVCIWASLSAMGLAHPWMIWPLFLIAVVMAHHLTRNANNGLHKRKPTVF